MLPQNHEQRIIARSTRLYGWVLRCYPKKFQQEYSQEILKDFHHHCRNAYTQNGTGGVLYLMLPMLTSAIADMGLEQLSEVVRREKKSLPARNSILRNKIRLGRIPRIALLSASSLLAAMFSIAVLNTPSGSLAQTTYVIISATAFIATLLTLVGTVTSISIEEILRKSEKAFFEKYQQKER